MERFALSRSPAYAAALISTIAAFLLTMAVWPIIKPAVSPIFIVAIVFSAWYSGFGPSLLATIVAAVLSAYFLMEPSYSVFIGGDDVARLGVFLFVTITTSSLMSARRRAEVRLRALLQDKETLLRQKDLLLREIHHRVKNNLQVISSLLMLQSAQFPDKRVKSLFEHSQRRVRTIALVHEKLHESEHMAEIHFSDYLSGLLSQLNQVHNLSEDIRVSMDIDDMVLRLDTAIPCALLVNELVSNAFEHAFAGGGPGEIRVELHAGMKGRAVLTVQDSGRGFPEGLDVARAQTLGLRLVTAFVEQLNGTLRVNRSGGTAFIVEFECQPAAQLQAH